MKKMILAIVAAITLSTTAVAQEENNQRRERRQQPDRTEMLKQRTDEMVKTYGLNEEQAKQLLELNTAFADKIGPMGGFQRGGNNGRRPQADRRQMGNREQVDTTKAREQRQRPTREGMEDRRKEMEQNREAYAAELQKIMTEDQYKAYQADMQKRMQNAPQGRRGQRPPRNNE